MLNINGATAAASVALQTLSPASKAVAEGYYAATNLDTVDADLAVGNIKTGTVIFGLTGTYDTEAGSPISAAALSTGLIGFVNGVKITGNNAAVVDTADATAIAADLASGKTAYVNGSKITGP